MNRKHLPWLSLLVLASVLAGCGGGGGGGGVADTAAPVISDISFTPPVRLGAGSVQITASVADAGGLGKVEAVVTPASGTPVTVAMTATGGGMYTAQFSYQANATQQAIKYTFVIDATDQAGNTVVSPRYTFDVPAGDTPPAPPFTPPADTPPPPPV